MKISKLSDLGGIQIEGVNLAVRSAEQDRELGALYDEHGLIVFRNQSLTKAQLVDATTPFGGLMRHRFGAPLDPKAEGIQVISNRGAHGEMLPEDPDEVLGKIDWHTDQGYVTCPNRGKILYAVEVPEKGGQTGFIDGQRTWEALPEPMRERIKDLHVVQSWMKIKDQVISGRRYRLNGDKELGENRFVDVVYGITHPHPHTGKTVLNVPPLWADTIVEMPEDEGRALIAELIAFIQKPEFQYWHSYQPGDAVIWDNWRFLHAAGGTAGRYVRTIWSVTVDSGPELGRPLESLAA
jgi:taurine dioxygenase